MRNLYLKRVGFYLISAMTTIDISIKTVGGQLKEPRIERYVCV